MMPTFRQQLVKRRTLLGAVTLLCLLWHILLPTLVHVGVVPALFAFPSHCQPAVFSNGYFGIDANNAPEQSIVSDYSRTNGLMQHQMPMPASTQQFMTASANDTFHTQHAHEVFTLASKIMKHCPLCSHGLDSGILIPLIVLLVILLVRWFALVRSLCYTWTKRLYIPHISFALPFKHAPPSIL